MSSVTSVFNGVRPSVAKMTIFTVIHGPGCEGSEVADEVYPGPEGSGAVTWGQDTAVDRAGAVETLLARALRTLPLVLGCLDTVLLVGSDSL